MARIKALVSDDGALVEPNSTVTLKASAVANKATDDATVSADATGNKSAVAGATVKFVVDGKTLTAVTDTKGHAAVTVPAARTVRTVNVSTVATTRRCHTETGHRRPADDHDRADEHCTGDHHHHPCCRNSG